MRRTLIAALATGAVAAATATGALAAERTTAPDMTVNLKVLLSDQGGRISGNPSWSKLMELPRGTYGRLIIHNTGKKDHTFRLAALGRNPEITIRAGKKVVVVADFLRRGEFKWTVDAKGGGVFRIF